MPYRNIVYAKLEKRLLNDHRWFTMTDQSQLIYIKLILIAQDTYNQIPKNVETLRQLCRCKRKNILVRSIEDIKMNFPKFKESENFYYFDDFHEKTNYIRECPSNAEGAPKAGVEKEKEEDKEKEKEEISPILDSWNSFAESLGLTKIIKLTEKRITGIKQRLKEKEFDLDEIFENIKKSKFLLGENDRNWKVDFDFIFLKKDNYIKILEGKYGTSSNAHKGLTYDEAITQNGGKFSGWSKREDGLWYRN